MKVSERREIMLQHRQRHIKQLQKLGYIYDKMNAIKALEHKANEIATRDCNGELEEAESEQLMLKVEMAVKRLFGGTLPHGFFINGDPRGYALKLDNDAYPKSDTGEYNLPINYQDWGGYMILAPEEY